MHEDEKAFLRAIKDNPDDDTNRLVYADWLQEQGGRDDFADRIRADVELKPYVADDGYRCSYRRYSYWCTQRKIGRIEKDDVTFDREMQIRSRRAAWYRGGDSTTSLWWDGVVSIKGTLMVVASATDIWHKANNLGPWITELGLYSDRGPAELLERAVRLIDVRRLRVWGTTGGGRLAAKFLRRAKAKRWPNLLGVTHIDLGMDPSFDAAHALYMLPDHVFREIEKISYGRLPRNSMVEGVIPLLRDKCARVDGKNRLYEPLNAYHRF